MKLDRKAIVDTALELLDREGLEGLTMRKLADALKVQAPALYWHFPGKPALLDDMAEALVRDLPHAIEASAEPRQVLRQVAVALRQALLARRDGGRLLAGTFVAGPASLSVAEIALAALLRAGFGTRTSARAIFSLLYFVLGFVIEEQALAEQASGTGGFHPLAAKLAASATEDFPHLRAVLPDLLETDQEERFAFGIDLVLRGLFAEESPCDRCR